MHSEQFHACPAVRDGVVSRLNKPASMQNQQVHKQACQRECASQASGARQVSAPSMKECRVETRVLPSSRRRSRGVNIEMYFKLFQRYRYPASRDLNRCRSPEGTHGARRRDTATRLTPFAPCG
jgi:hypothetical protein